MPIKKLLFVDDEPDFASLVEQQFDGKINDYEVSFVFAENGLEALKKLEEHPDIELVMADINMPVMDGLEFVTRATKLDRLLKIIMVSAYSDMSNLRKAMNRGAYDFVVKPVDFGDLTETIQKTLQQIDQIKKDEAELKRLQEIEKEMEIAKKILTSLLPAPFMPSSQSSPFEVFGTLMTARMMGGEFYDFFEAGSNRLAIIMGETDAKGIAAAIYVVSAREALRRFMNQNLDLEVCTKQINDYLFYQKTPEIPSFTLFFGILNTETGEFEYTSAGLPPLLLVSKEGNITERAISNPLMGSFLQEKHNINKITLKTNEGLIIRSREMPKIKNKENQTYPDPRLKELISAHYSQPLPILIDTIILDVKSFIEPIPLTNDYIVLALKFKG